MNRAKGYIRPLSVLIASLLSPVAPAQGVDMGASAAALGLSDYHYFVIYPHLDKALKAQKNNDEATALREFAHAHQQAPDNVPLTLYLAEGLRHFGHDEEARKLLTGQLKRHPEAARLRQSLEAIPVNAAPVNTVADLLAQQRACDADPSTRCRSEVGQNALRHGKLTLARQQLSDPAFAAQAQGRALRDGIIQRAIYLRQWRIADEMFSERNPQSGLNDKERGQWWTVLLAGRMDDRIETLQSQGLFNGPEERLDWAASLARRAETARLQRLLAGPSPEFKTAEQEQRWLYLFSRYSVKPGQALSGYNAQFNANRRYLAGEALNAGDYPAARRVLATLPADDMPEARYALSLASHNAQESLRFARALYARHPQDQKRLDALTWQLIQAGRPQEAAQTLLQRYPFSADPASGQKLLARLSLLLRNNPEWATPAQRARLRQPLSSPALRQWQSELPGLAEDCEAIRSLLGDMSPAYNAAAWGRLAACYRDEQPGLALYALQQAEVRSPDAWHHRAVAYQAYQVQDYATAMQAWRQLKSHELSNADLAAAANTAQAAGDGEMLARWLEEEQKRGLDNTEHYWWLHAQRWLPAQPEQALADFSRALAIAPSARAWASRAAIYRQQGNARAAVSDLRQALAQEPYNSVTMAALGYALWDAGDIVASREMLEHALKAMPDDPALIRQLAYVSQRLNAIPDTQYYARQVIDDIDNNAQAGPLTAAQRQQRFAFRRLHEDSARRWSYSLDTSVGLRSGAVNAARNAANAASPGNNYRSYGQMEAEYRLGRSGLVEGDLWSLYGRLFADTSGYSVAMPARNPMLGAGIRWKPLRDRVLFLALEQQVPLDRHHGEPDTLIRASASFFNGGRFSDEWHPNGAGWFANNLYLDGAHFVRQDIQAWTADYRVSWHQKVAQGQTLEPYAHLQVNGYRDETTRGTQTGGAGMRWNIWTGETRYDAWPHKISLGLEYQRTFKAINQHAGERNNAFVTLGVHW